MDETCCVPSVQFLQRAQCLSPLLQGVYSEEINLLIHLYEGKSCGSSYSSFFTSLLSFSSTISSVPILSTHDLSVLQIVGLTTTRQLPNHVPRKGLLPCLIFFLESNQVLHCQIQEKYSHFFSTLFSHPIHTFLRYSLPCGRNSFDALKSHSVILLGRHL